jgi:hypothetical protein
MAASTYQYTDRIVAYTDVLNITPSVLGPMSGSDPIDATSITLSWTKVDAPPPLNYDYQLATDSVFANLVDTDTNPTTSTGTGNTRGTSVIMPPPGNAGLTPGTTYYWRMRVANPVLSKWSSTQSFVTTIAAPALKSPEYGSETVGMRPTFSWLAVQGAETYELEMSTNPFFAMPEAIGPLSHTTWTWEDDLDYGTTYYWRVRGVTADGNKSKWTDSVFTVKLEAAPEAPPVVVTETPAPQITMPDITLTSPPVEVTIPEQAAPAPSPVTPAVIWAIIIIGAVLVIAVIVLIVRTRRVP